METVERRQRKVRCLYIVPNSPISPNYRGGGSAIYYEQLLSLVSLGVEVHLWHFCYDSRLAEFEKFIESEPQVWADLTGACASLFRTTISSTPSLAERIYNKSSNLLTGKEIRNPLVRGKCFSEFKNVVSKVKPDLIWAQHLVPTQISLLQKRIPTVYSHHDWLYKVKNLNNEQGLDQRSKTFEENAARSSAAVVSGSMVECEQLSRIGCNNVHYIPVAYEDAPISLSMNGHKARVVHLGGLATTATRVGLERFFTVVFDKLHLGPSDMLVVGDVSTATEQMRRYLDKVTPVGYVKDLATVLRPYDIHVIPWEHETGQRTRVVQAFNFGQALVATRKSVSCFPEVIDGENCLLVDSLDEMPAAIDRLMNDRGLRHRLGSRARETFETQFTRDVLLPRYQRVVDSVIKRAQATVA